MEIRHAVVDDAQGIAETNAAAWKTAFRGVVNDAFLDTFDGIPETRRDNLLNLAPEALQLVAVKRGEVVGWLAAAPAKEDDCDQNSTFEVAACYVRPDHWRSGVGRELMDYFLSHLDLDRWRELVLWTAKNTVQSHRFYESFGFRRDGKESMIDKQGPVAIVRFRRSLPREG